MPELLPAVVVETAKNPDATIIWLHGLGSDGHDFEAIVPALTLSSALSVRFVFPHAPIRSVTINNGMTMRAWYDILDMTLERRIDKDNIRVSCQQVSDLIDDQIAKGIRSERIVLAGFSQGGVIAYKLALTTAHKLAGVMALSTYLSDKNTVPFATTSVNEKTSFFIQHGVHDPVIALDLSKDARHCLVEKGFDVKYETYDMPHTVCPEQIKDISAWLTSCLMD